MSDRLCMLLVLLFLCAIPIAVFVSCGVLWGVYRHRGGTASFTEWLETNP